MEKFKKSAAALFTDADAMVSAVRAVYDEVPILASDTTLRNIILDAWILGGKELQMAAADSFHSLVGDVPDFAADLANKLMGGFAGHVRHHCQSRGRKVDVEKANAMAVAAASNCTRCNTKAKEEVNVLSTVKMNKFW